MKVELEIPDSRILQIAQQAVETGMRAPDPSMRHDHGGELRIAIGQLVTTRSREVIALLDLPAEVERLVRERALEAVRAEVDEAVKAQAAKIIKEMIKNGELTGLIRDAIKNGAR